MGGKTPTWRENGSVNEAVEDEIDWAEMDADLYYWTRALRPVQVWVAVYSLVKFLMSLKNDIEFIFWQMVHSGILAILQKQKKN